ncbi:hypothetical protein ID866_5510 [Astraeus odoratus]|nr:hypothetical protein ID866_5510 [Astraeus odoratus]
MYDAQEAMSLAPRKEVKKYLKKPQMTCASPTERTVFHGFHGYFKGKWVATPEEIRPPALSLQDLECIRTLGQGAYGNVVLVRVRLRPNPHTADRPGSVFAMKILSKAEMQSFDERHPNDADVEIASLCKLPWSPFINGVVSAFHDSANLYLMLECIPSGCLHDIIHKRGPLDATSARFYYANITCALLFLHGHGIVHRDLKPTNILMKPDGYLALADFGLAKPESDNLWHKWTMVGTPVYMAPELVYPQDAIGRSIDWWSSGIILYEMITKRLPFYAQHEADVFQLVQSGRYKWPRNIRVGKTLKSFVGALLRHNAEQRLGVVEVVMGHAWLQGIDWCKMERHQYVVRYSFQLL